MKLRKGHIMSNIKINYTKNTIEITKSFEKKAMVFASPEYKELIDAKREFPNYRIVITTNKGSNTFKGMDYKFMEEYIAKQVDAETRTQEFKRLLESKLVGYAEVKQWFVDKYPVFKTCKTKADWILAA